MQYLVIASLSSGSVGLIPLVFGLSRTVGGGSISLGSSTILVGLMPSIFPLRGIGVAVMFPGAVLLIAAGVLVFILDYSRSESNGSCFVAFVLLFVLPVGLLVYSLNLAKFPLGSDGPGTISFLLASHYQNSGGLAVGLMGVLLSRVGGVVLLVAISAALSSGSHLVSLSSGPLLYGLVVLAATIKRVQASPLLWSPTAMAALIFAPSRHYAEGSSTRKIWQKGAVIALRSPSGELGQELQVALAHFVMGGKLPVWWVKVHISGRKALMLMLWHWPVEASVKLLAAPPCVAMVVGPRATSGLGFLKAWSMYAKAVANCTPFTGEWSSVESVSGGELRLNVGASQYGSLLYMKLTLQSPADSFPKVMEILLELSPSGAPLRWFPLGPTIVLGAPRG